MCIGNKSAVLDRGPVYAALTTVVGLAIVVAWSSLDKINAMKQSAFAPGFRLSVRDGLVLVAGIGAQSCCRCLSGVGVHVGFVVGHFFLFCNVFA